MAEPLQETSPTQTVTSATADHAILVLGTHRSGTSAAAGCLARAGLDFGDKLLAANQSNPLGHYEDRELVALHDALLADFGRRWHDPRPMPSNWLTAPAVEPHREKLRAVLRDRFVGRSWFGLKDPRLCRLVPLYQQIFADLGVETRCVCILRHPDETAGSLEKRDGFARGKGWLLWLRDLLDNERTTRGLPRSWVRYEDLLENPVHTVANTCAELGWAPTVPDWEAAVRAGVRSDLRHHRGTAGIEHPWLASAWQSIGDLAAGGEAPQVSRRLDELTRVLDNAATLYETSLEDLARRLELAHVTLRVESGESDSAKDHVILRRLTERTTADLRSELEDRERHVERLRAENGEHQAAVGALRATLFERDRRLRGVTEERDRALQDRERALQDRDRALQDALLDRDRALQDRERAVADLERAVIDLERSSQDRDRALQDRDRALEDRTRAAEDRDRALADRDHAVADRDRVRHELEHIAAQRARESEDLARAHFEIQNRSVELRHASEQVDSLLHEIGGLRRSLSWRMTSPIRKLLDETRTGFRRARRSISFDRLRRLRGLLTKDRVRAAWNLVRKGQVREAALRARSVAHVELATHTPEPGPGGFVPARPRDPYELHVARNTLTARRRRRLGERMAATTTLPSVSVIVPVYEPPVAFLERAVQSVLDQVHGDFELILCNDGSPSPEVRPALDELAARDPRIRVLHLDENGGIARATNAAAAAATGDLLAFLDQDDELSPDALAEIALAASDPAVDIVYSDDDKIDAAGKRYAPQFKPDWSPELLLSFSYFSHVFALRRTLFERVGGVREGFEGAQDYDLMLRASERARAVAHVPRVLYHWRSLPGSTASDGREKPKSLDAGRRAVADALQRRGVQADGARIAPWAETIGCGIYEPVFPDDGPRVAIVIPSKNGHERLTRSVPAIEKLTRYRNYEIVLVDNGSDDPESAAWYARCGHRVLRIENPRAGIGGFSYAAVNNRAVEQLDADYVLFLNDDTEVREPSWLSQMVGWLQVDGVGAVGARLLFPDGRLQHAGIVHGLYEGMAGPAFKLQPEWDGGHLSLARVARDCSAVTAAALLIRRDTFLDLGGFDEDHFAVAYNDVDLCYRLRATGKRIVYCPNAELVHVEGASRGTGPGNDDPREEADFRERYRGLRDPYYNPNLSLESERFEIRGTALPEAPGRPIRAAMIGFNLDPEGSSNSQFELTVALRDRGVLDPVVMCTSDGSLRDEYEARGIEVGIFEHPMLHVHEVPLFEERIAKFAETLRATGAEVVYANTMQTFYVVLAAAKAGIPAVWNIRESEPWRHYFDFLAPELRPRALEAFEKAYAVVFVSGRTREVYHELDSVRAFRLIRNGLEPERARARLRAVDRAAARAELGYPEHEIVLLCLGTVCERKGQIEAVEAFARLRDGAAERARLLVVGDRPSAYSDELHRRIAALPPERRARVHVEGEQAQIARYYAAADVFVFTSRFESYPRVVLEAMYAGLPIVSTPCFGVTEQVRDRVNALLYPVGEPDVLASHLQLLVDDDGLRTKLADNSPEVLRTLPDFEQMVDGYARVFEEAWTVGDD